MNKLLALQEKFHKSGKPSNPNISRLSSDEIDTLYTRSGNRQKRILAERYLPVVGKLFRNENERPIPLIPVQLDGVYEKGTNKEIKVKELIYKSLTNAKGAFFLALSYDANEESKFKNAEVHLSIGGQDEVFKLDILPFEQKGESEFSSLFEGKQTNSIFPLLGLPNQRRLLHQHQLTNVSIGKLTIQ